MMTGGGETIPLDEGRRTAGNGAWTMMGRGRGGRGGPPSRPNMDDPIALSPTMRRHHKDADDPPRLPSRRAADAGTVQHAQKMANTARPTATPMPAHAPAVRAGVSGGGVATGEDEGLGKGEGEGGDGVMGATMASTALLPILATRRIPPLPGVTVTPVHSPHAVENDWRDCCTSKASPRSAWYRAKRAAKAASLIPSPELTTRVM